MMQSVFSEENLPKVIVFLCIHKYISQLFLSPYIDKIAYYKLNQHMTMIWLFSVLAHIAPDKFDKEYSYNIRYNYGKEGKKVNWAPKNCMRYVNYSTHIITLGTN